MNSVPVERLAWAMHDYRDAGGRVTHGAVTEEVEHQKQALQAMQGAIAERSKSRSIVVSLKNFSAYFASLR
jgi:hypothetical protein